MLKTAKILLICAPMMVLGACASNNNADAIARAQATADQALATANQALSAAQACQSRCEAGFDRSLRK